MKELPILFKGEMVRAILEGRKTVTRRAISARALRDIGYGVQLGECHELPVDGPLHPNSVDYYTSFCPFGLPGDRLWVRESFWHAGSWVATYPEDDTGSWFGTRRVHYRANGVPPNEPNHHYPNGLSNGAYSAAEPAKLWRARPSIHMPRWASRILLEITAVRLERLHEMKAADYQAEGCHGGHGSIPGYIYNATPGEHFHHVWDSTGGDWKANPWVWVIEFRRVDSGCASETQVEAA